MKYLQMVRNVLGVNKWWQLPDFIKACALKFCLESQKFFAFIACTLEKEAKSSRLNLKLIEFNKIETK